MREVEPTTAIVGGLLISLGSFIVGYVSGINREEQKKSPEPPALRYVTREDFEAGAKYQVDQSYNLHLRIMKLEDKVDKLAAKRREGD